MLLGNDINNDTKQQDASCFIVSANFQTHIWHCVFKMYMLKCLCSLPVKGGDSPMYKF